MQLIPDPVNITFLAYGNSCQVQAMRDTVAFLIAAQNLSMLIQAKAATFEEGFDPCRNFSFQDQLREMYGVGYSRKCHFYSKDIYNDSDLLLTLSEEDLHIARVYTTKDPRKKLRNALELVEATQIEQISNDAGQFYKQAQVIAQMLVERVRKGTLFK